MQGVRVAARSQLGPSFYGMQIRFDRTKSTKPFSASSLTGFTGLEGGGSRKSQNMTATRTRPGQNKVFRKNAHGTACSPSAFA